MFDVAASVNLVSATLDGIKRVVVLSDLYRIDDRLPDLLPSPAKINTLWIYELFGPATAALFGVPAVPAIEFDYPDALSRISVYRRLGREFGSHGWASLYDGLGDARLEAEIAERFCEALVISYELPPYLRAIFERNRIPYVDLFIHPVRFLPDYIFGARSNVRSVYDRIVATEISDDLIRAFARISAARTARVHRSIDPLPGSAVFFGQIKIDASLITNGQIATEQDVEAALLDLASTYPVVYYKSHPYVEDADALRARLTKLPKLKWVSWNAYDVLALDRVGVCASLSSGTLLEARYFDMPTERFLPERELVPAPGTSDDDAFSRQLFRPTPPAVFDTAYWAYILGHADAPPPLRMPDPVDGALKFSLNMKWGR